MKFVHAADLHLDSPMRGLERYAGAPADTMRVATRVALERLVALCLAERAELLLLAGDLFDGDWHDYSTGLHLRAELVRLREVGTRVVLVRGNHDAATQITKHLRWPDHVKELSTRAPETVRFEEIGVAVHGQGFAKRDVRDDLAAGYPTPVRGLFHIGLLHTALAGREGHEAYAPTTASALAAKGYDYWALGHVHAREVVSQEPWIVFPGNLQGRHVRETGAKGATLVTVEDGRVAAVEHRVLDAARWAVSVVDVTSASSAHDAMDLVRAAIEVEAHAAEGRPVAVRVVLRGATRAHGELARDRERWVEQVRAEGIDVGGAWIERVRFETAPEVDASRLAERDDAVGDLLRYFRRLRGTASDAELGELAAELADLQKKIPPELLTGDDALRLDDPATLRKLLEDVEGELVPLLLEGELP